MNTTPHLEARALSKTYHGETGQVEVFADFSLSLSMGTVLSVIGPSGCGKSTLLAILGGWIKPDTGLVLLKGKQADGPSPARPVCFQGDSTFRWMTVRQNIEFGMRAQGRIDDPLIEQLLSRTGLDEVAAAWPRELSGGMRKRLELARVMAAATPGAVLLMDEAFASVDPPTRVGLHILLRDLIQAHNYSAILVSHDTLECAFASDEVIVLSGRPAQVRHHIMSGLSSPRTESSLWTTEFRDFHNQILDCYFEGEFSG